MDYLNSSKLYWPTQCHWQLVLNYKKGNKNEITFSVTVNRDRCLLCMGIHYSPSGIIFLAKFHQFCSFYTVVIPLHIRNNPRWVMYLNKGRNKMCPREAVLKHRTETFGSSINIVNQPQSVCEPLAVRCSISPGASCMGLPRAVIINHP